MNYTSANEILTQVLQLQYAQQTLQRNRALIAGLMDGDAPYTPAELEQFGLNSNVNFLEGTRICQNATNQLDNAFEKTANYFTVKVAKGPMRFRNGISRIITREINKELKLCRPWKEARKSARAQVVLHGPGPLVWRDRYRPVPGSVGVEDVLIPAGTLCDMENLDRFAIYRELAWPQLNDTAFGSKPFDPGWNQGYVKALLATMYKSGYQPIYQGNRWLFPEKLEQDFKEGASWSYSSSLPKVLAWDFFYRNEDSDKWNRKMVLDYNSITPTVSERNEIVKNQQVIYERENYADDWQQIIQWYIGNCSNVGPYRYHSIRSVGYLLYAICMLNNKFRNRAMDYTFTQLLTWFRNVSDDNREKLGLIDLQNYGVLPDGVSMVPQSERYAVDSNQVLLMLNQNRQLMAESSASFIPEMPGGPDNGKTMTATETLVRQNTSVTLTSAVLSQLGDQSLFEYREIARRFCMKSNPDPMAKRFRECLQKEGIPLDYLDFEYWEILPELGRGGGNKAQELTVTRALMSDVFPLVDSGAQRIILRDYASALTDSPEFAAEIVPEQPETGGMDVQHAQAAFSVLMEGTPFVPQPGADPVVMAQVLMGMVGVVLNQIQAAVQQPSGVAMAAEKVFGAANVMQFVQGAIAKVSQAESRKDLAAKLLKQWALLNGELQQLAKAVQAAEEQMQPQMNGEEAKLQAKIREMQLTGETQRQIATQNAEQKLSQRQIQWLTTTQQKEASTAADIHRKIAVTRADLHAKDLTTQAELIRQAAEAAAEPAEEPA